MNNAPATPAQKAAATRARNAEAKAIARLRAAQDNHRAVTAHYAGWSSLASEYSPASLAVRAAKCELNAAQWPFVSGKYPWPNRTNA